jgi:hypothetical protein
VVAEAHIQALARIIRQEDHFGGIVTIHITLETIDQGFGRDCSLDLLWGIGLRDGAIITPETIIPHTLLRVLNIKALQVPLDKRQGLEVLGEEKRVDLEEANGFQGRVMMIQGYLQVTEVLEDVENINLNLNNLSHLRLN